VRFAGLIAGVALAVGGAGAEPPGAELLPPGPGREAALRVCTGCHEVEVIAHRTQAQVAWPDIVQAMAEKGAEASPQELAQIAAYLEAALPAK